MPTSEVHPLVGCNSASCVVLNRPSPFSSLPAEIMHLIFDFGSDLQPSRKGEPPFNFTVSQVDRRWRMIAFNTASLWARIVITPKMPARYIELYLQRSGSHELDIQLKFKHHLSHGHPRISKPIFSHLKHCARRWKRFSVITSSRMNVSLATHMLGKLVLPRLQSLYFSEIGDPGTWMRLPWTVLNLTTLRLDGVAFNLTTLPLQGITSLHLEDYRIHKVTNIIDGANIFHAMPRLQSLILMGSVLDMKDFEDASNISLPFLSFLQISDTDIAFTFMDIVSAPSLRSLVLTNILKPLVKRATRSRSARFPSVNSLTITDTFLDLDSYAVMFHFFFPSLTHLAVLDSDVEPIFTLLCTAPNPLLRCLHTLTLSSLPVSLLRPFIVDRCARGHPICALNLTSSLIAELHADGLQRWLEKWLVEVGVFHEDALVDVPWVPRQ